MPTPPPDNAFDRLLRSLTPADPTNDPYGDHKLRITGTVNILGGGAGGTSQTDDANYLPGSSSLTPIGGYYGGRSIGSGHAAAPALSGSAILQVDVVAGGAGGGAAQNQIQGTAGNWVGVGVASGAAGAAGNWALPVVYASGVYPTVNVGNAHGIFGSVSMVGSVNVTPVASFTVNLGSIPNVVGSVGVTPLGTFTVNVVNGAGGYATVGVYGSVNVIGSVNATNLGGSVGVIGAGGSMGVTQIGTPWGMVGSVGVTPLATFTVALDKIPTVNLGLGTVNIGNLLTATVTSAFGLQVVGTAGTLQGVGVASGAAGLNNWALPVVYASGLYPTVNLGAAVGIFGSVGVGGLGGSMGVTQLGAPWSVVGSMGVTPLASFTVNLGTIATVNLGLGTVNVGNAHGIFGSVSILGSVNVGGAVGVTGSVSILGSVNVGGVVAITGSVSILGSVNVGGVVLANVAGSLTATTWPIVHGGSGNFTVVAAASGGPGGKVKFHSITVIATGTADIAFQSPSGTYLTGSLRLLPGAGFAQNTALFSPILISASGASFNLIALGTQNLGGWCSGWVDSA